MKKDSLLGLIIAVMITSGIASAGEVEPSSVTTFSAGSEAKASEVNANFDALIAAINDNAARIEALEAASSTDNSVAGHTYSLRFYGTILAAKIPNGQGDREYQVAEHYAGKGSMTFTAGGSGSGSVGDIAGAEVGIGNFGDIWWENHGAEVPEPLTLTWSQDGNAVTVAIDGETAALQFVVSEDGSLLVGHFTDSGLDMRDDGSTADFSDISTAILIRN